ncbi:Integrase [uncultured Candidatus Thioglobus sp.]|nr:Integrase [uncultured Candidatus Thioglobus sp.]
MKLEKLLELYQQEKPQLSPRTIQKYKSIVRMFTQDAGIDDIFITRNECIRWRNKILNRSSAGNCNNYHRHLKSLFNVATKLGYLESNVFNSIPILKNVESRHKTISNATLERLVSMVINDNYYSQHAGFYMAMIDVFRFTGIRRRQLIGIRWCDVDFDKHSLYLNAKFSKNGRDNLIPINQTLIEHFMSLKKNSRAKVRDQVFNITEISHRYKGNKMTESHVSQLFVKWSNKIGVPISSHRFRHTVATKIANSGCNLKSLQQLLGHTDIKTTFGYIETNIDDLREIQSVL